MAGIVAVCSKVGRVWKASMGSEVLVRQHGLPGDAHAEDGHRREPHRVKKRLYVGSRYKPGCRGEGGHSEVT